MWLTAFKFLLNPKTLMVIALFALIITILVLVNQKLSLKNEIIVLNNSVEVLESHNQKCVSEQLIMSDNTKYQNEIIDSLRSNLEAERANCKELLQAYEVSIDILNKSHTIPLEEGGVVDEKTSSDIINLINTLY